MNVIEQDRNLNKIHSINAEYLLSSEPHRLYAHSSNGNLLELAVERFTNRTDELLYGHGGIIAVGACNTAQRIAASSAFILKPNGEILSLNPEG